MAQESSSPAELSIDYPDRTLDRFSSFFRILFVIPIALVLSLIGGNIGGNEENLFLLWAGGSFGVLWIPVILMILFRQKYPRWWFDWNCELLKFQYRIQAYLMLMSDQYPSTDEDQYVHLRLNYPDVPNDLNRWMPLVKWLLAIPHYVVLAILYVATIVVVIIAWFAILFTGRYPEGLFSFVLDVLRYELRVLAYAFVLVTDTYPPFSLGD